MSKDKKDVTIQSAVNSVKEGIEAIKEFSKNFMKMV